MAEKPSFQKQLTKLGILALIVLVVIAVFQFTPLESSDFTPENIKNFILGFGILSPLVFLFLYGLRGVLLIIPVLAMSLTSGLAFGVWWGWLLNVTGATLNASVSFLLVRYFGRGIIDSIPFFQSGKLKSFDDKAAEHGLKVIIFMRLIPLFQYDAVNFGGGLSKIKFRDFALGSFIGMIPGGFITNFLGSSLENWKSPKFFIAVAAFILLMFVPFFYKKFKKSKTEEPVQDN